MIKSRLSLNLFGNESRRILVGIAILGLSGCGGSQTPATPVTVTVSKTETVAVSAAPPAAPTVTTPPSVETPSALARATTRPATAITVPDGVGLDYQQAQDLWRGAGLHVAPAIDALGANRLPVIDSNWIVLSQKPKAGTKVEADALITATVKKKTDK